MPERDIISTFNKEINLASLNRHTTARRLLALMIAFITFSLPVTQGVVLAETSTIGTRNSDDTQEIVEVQYPDLPPQAPDNFTNVRYINVPFQTRGRGIPYSYAFPYTDEMFSQPVNEFSMTMAQASIGLTFSAFRTLDASIMVNQNNVYLASAGFENIYAFGYNDKTWADTLAGVIASKQVGDTTVIAIAPCGQGYGKEWAGNLWIGTDTIHAGFRASSEILEERVYQYIEDNNITGSMTIWISGFSRAAATANIAAAEFIESGRFDAVYAYLYAVPNNTQEPVAYEGIYNICGKYDPIRLVPWSAWGYGRHGTDLYLPAQETESNYAELFAAASAVEQSITGAPLHNNPEHNYQLRLILEAIPEIFPTAGDYASRLQEPLMSVLLRQDRENIIDAMITVGTNMSHLQADYWSVSTITDYISYLATEHLSGNKRQIEDGNWDENNAVAQNFLAEHQVIVYLDWMFSGLDYEELFGGSLNSRRLVISGEVEVSVYRDGEPAGSIDIDGNHDYQGAHGVFMMRTGDITNVIMPMDENYDVVIFKPEAGMIDYHNIIQSINILPGEDSEEYVYGLAPGEYVLHFDTTAALPEIEVRDGDINYSLRDVRDYSVREIMAQESSSTFHITLGMVTFTLKVMTVLLLALLLVCMIIAVVHDIMRKHGHPPFSPMYVIVPHIILIAWFAFLTEFMVRYLNVVTVAKSFFATITMALIFLLAFRGFLRNKSKMTFFCAFMLGALTVATWFGFAVGPLGAYTRLTVIIFAAAVVFLTFLAMRNFYRGRTGKVKEN